VKRTGKGSDSSLFEHAGQKGRLESASRAPLADRMRPKTLDELCGQRHLLAEGKWLRRAIVADSFPSLILWGPPGVGKTTLARVIAGATRRIFVPFSAVLGGVPELRAIVSEAKEERKYRGRSTVLFVDELHRFNKSQQDALLPHVEDGTITLIGATTENPSFSINAAILSRAKVQRLESLRTEDLMDLLRRALFDVEEGYGAWSVSVEDATLEMIARTADGDARRALSLLEAALSVGAVETEGATLTLGVEELEPLLENKTLLYDKSGDEHYNVISALIKSMRGSDPDAAIYWLMRMLEAGDDPLFILRRLMIFASEDVGNADPRALTVAVSADEAFRRMGLPEGIYPISQACLYLSCCPKSNAVTRAFQGAREEIKRRGALPVPHKLRNAPTQLMKAEGYGQGYRYAHDYPGGVVPGEQYLPDDLHGVRFYEPTQQGLEKAIGERLARIRAAFEGPGAKGGAGEESSDADGEASSKLG
jgi:putative ATPase